jgi:hypothetical protein
VVDKFHLSIKLWISSESRNRRSRHLLNRTKFYKSSLTLLMAGEKLDDDGYQRLIEIFKLAPMLYKAWELKEEFCDLLQIPDVKESIQALNHWYENVSQSKLNLFWNQIL